MSQTRTIKDYFKRPSFVQNSKYIQPSSSPLSDPPSDFPSHFASSQQLPEPHVEPQRKDTPSPDHSAQPSHGSNGTFRRSSSLGGSFNSSQRIVKNGQEMVIDSDADSLDSVESLEAADELLNKFLDFTSKKRDMEGNRGPSSKLGTRKNKNPLNFRAMSESQGRKYKFSMESLVTRAVNDDEAEASVAKAKALLHGDNKTTSTLHSGSQTEITAPNLHEDVLASALATDDQETDLQRLLNAVKRTEAFEQEKSWSFFGDRLSQEAPEFPRDSIDPSSSESFLREAFSRDRAFYSGIIDFALSRERLPDEVLIWIFHSVPSEPRDELRYAYRRAIEHAGSRRLESLVGPEDIEQAFLGLGGTLTAVDISEPIRPKISHNSEKSSHNWNLLLSLLDMLKNIASHLRVDTKESALHILFRLTLDTDLSNNNLVMETLESTIDSLLQSIPHDKFEKFEQTMQPISRSIFKAINDATFQSRLLGHILPTIPQIALFRCRLAMAFLCNDEAQLEKSSEDILSLRGVINHLKHTRLDVKLHKARLESNYDYNELKAITSLLNVVIDSGRTTLEFPDKESERQFNADVDTLAEQVKRIFNAIEDSGASHLKRTEAKQGLEALRYRIIFSIRSRPHIKSIFGQDNEGGSSAIMNDWFQGRQQKRIKTESPAP